MAFTRSRLVKLAGGAQQLFYYRSTDNDAIGTVVGSGFFNTATEDLRQGDIILVGAGTDGLATVDVVIVTSATGAATVTTVNGT